mmetsp:Transcript_8012/g.8518  ORF Transcript_8012/g.8518 Transcript_8012/m.8518 type:complete len:187 (+) Transcript_8012:43-603(+)
MSLPSNKSYLDLINEAILTSNKRTGISLQAIRQYIHIQYPNIDLKNNYLRAALKKGINEERIIQIEGFLKYKLNLDEKKALMKRKSIMTSVEQAKRKLQRIQNKNKVENKIENNTKKKSIQIIQVKKPILKSTNNHLNLNNKSNNSNNNKSNNKSTQISSKTRSSPRITSYKERKMRLDRMLGILA